MAVRTALGASRKAVAAQLLVEVAVLTIGGAVAGTLVVLGAFAAFRVLAANLPRMDEVAFDGSLLLYTAVSSAVVTLLCGVLPAVRSAGTKSADGLSDTGRTQVSGRHPLQWLLVGAQVALSIALLTGAGLLLRSFQALSQVSPGFESNRVLTFRVSGSFAETGDFDRLLGRIERTLDALRAMPEVEAAATSGIVPGVPGSYEATFGLAEERAETEAPIVAESRAVSPSYFQTMRIPLVAGELCRQRPIDGRGTDVMVNALFANRYLVGPAAIGRELTDGTNLNLSPGRIAGIVGDAREQGIDREPVPTVYWCFSVPGPTPAFLVRTRGEPEAMAQAVRLKLDEIEPLRSIYDVASLDERIGDAFAENRLRTAVLAFFAATALALTCLGVYGTLSYATNLRRREVGLRLALGAMRGAIVRQLLGTSLRVVVVACMVGMGLSLLLARALAGMLYGVSPTDPATLLGVVALVLLVATIASLLPALRAAFVEPMTVLGEE